MRGMYIHIYSFKALVRLPQVLESEIWCRGQHYSKKRENVYFFFLLLYHFECSKSKSECFHCGQLSSYIYIFLNACGRETLLTLTSKDISISKCPWNFGFKMIKWKWLKIWQTVKLDGSPYVEDRLKVKNIDIVLPVFQLSTFSKKCSSIFRIEWDRTFLRNSNHTTRKCIPEGKTQKRWEFQWTESMKTGRRRKYVWS